MADDLQIVVASDPQVVVVPLPDIQVLTEVSAQPVVVESPAVEVVTLDGDSHVVDEVRDIQIVTVGEAGPRGATGAAGSDAQMNFAYGDATPAPIVTATASKVVYSVEVIITEAFDGAGAVVTVGDATVADRLMHADENTLTSIGSNTTAPAYNYNVDTPILLSIAPGAGASQGRGVVIIRIQS